VTTGLERAQPRPIIKAPCPFDDEHPMKPLSESERAETLPGLAKEG
jgi:hypothetical protein